MYKRLFRYLTKVSGDILGIAEPLTKQQAHGVLRRVLGRRTNEEVEDRAALIMHDISIFGTSFEGWHFQAKALRYVPLLIKIQRMLFNKGIKSFTVVPKCKPGLRKILYTNTALKELLRTAGRKKAGQTA